MKNPLGLSFLAFVFFIAELRNIMMAPPRSTTSKIKHSSCNKCKT